MTPRQIAWAELHVLARAAIVAIPVIGVSAYMNWYPATPRTYALTTVALWGLANLLVLIVNHVKPGVIDTYQTLTQGGDA